MNKLLLNLMVMGTFSLNAMEDESYYRAIGDALPVNTPGVYIERVSTPGCYMPLRVSEVAIERDGSQPMRPAYVRRLNDIATPLVVVARSGLEAYGRRRISLERCTIEEVVGKYTSCLTACLEVENLLDNQQVRHLWLRKYFVQRGQKGHFEVQNPNYREDFDFEPSTLSQTVLTITIPDSTLQNIQITSKTTPCTR